MKKATVITISICLQILCYSNCFSQSQRIIDSLLNVLKTEKEDTIKVKTLSLLSENLLRTDLNKSLDYANQSLALAQKLGFKRYIVAAYQDIAGYYYYKSDLKTAMEFTEKTIPIIREINNQRAMGSTYSNLSLLAMRQSNYSEAIDYSNKAMKIGEVLKDSNIISDCYSAKGTIYTDIGDYTEALGYFFKALKINETRHNKSKIAGDYFDIGKIYLVTSDNSEKATYYSELSLKTARECNDQIHIEFALQQMGTIYQNKQDLNKALEYFQQALSIAEVMGDPMNIGTSTLSVGLIYSQLGQYDKAISSLLNALNISKQVSNKNGECTAYGYLGEIYMKKKDYKTAIGYLNESVSVSKNLGLKNNESCGLIDLAKCYENLKDYKLAYDYSNKYADLRNSILNEASINKINEIEARYNFDKNEKAIALLTKDKQIQQLAIKKQTFLKNAFIIVLALTCILFFFVYRNYRTRQQLKLQQLRNKIAIDLHDDIGSTLSSISIFSEIARQQSSEVVPMLEQINENSHKMLESMADIVWTINPANDNFEKTILRMRSFAFELLGARKIDFEFYADESIAKLNLPMNVRKNLYLIFKEATNNLVKYSAADRASFSISNTKNNLTLLIRDNGKGFNTEVPADGNGLKNMKNRAMEIGAKFLIESEPGTGTTIQLLINVA